jgi:hypothetical protein
MKITEIEIEAEIEAKAALYKSELAKLARGAGGSNAGFSQAQINNMIAGHADGLSAARAILRKFVGIEIGAEVAS